MKNNTVHYDIYYYHNECKSDIVKLGSYIKNITKHPESNIYTVIEQCINNVKVFDEILKHFSTSLKKIIKCNDLSIEMIMSLSNYLNILTNLFNSMNFKYFQPFKLQYNQFNNLFQYNRDCFERIVDFFEYSLSYFKEMNINLLKIILSK